MAVGLSTHIWNNNLRSVMLLILYPVVLLAIFWAIVLLISVFASPGNVGPEQTFSYGFGVANRLLMDSWLLILTATAIWFMISWQFHTSMIRALAHSHAITRKEEPALYNLLENLCISRGLSMPHLEIIESNAFNAFASGISQKSFTITVTRGLIENLEKDELEAVLAHELTHIENRDVRLLIISVIFTGMIGFFAQLAWSIFWRSLYRSSDSDKGKGKIALLIILLVLWAGYFVTMFTRFAISRRREFMADAGAVMLTKNPEAMMRALQRISGRDKMEKASADIAMMCVENSQPFFGLFMTHPPIDSRIQTISDMTGAPVPDISPAIYFKNDITTETKTEKRRNPWGFRKKNPWTP